MYRVRDEAIHMWKNEDKTKNGMRMPYLSERCTNNFKDLEVAIKILLSIKRVDITRNSFRPGAMSPHLT